MSFQGFMAKWAAAGGAGGGDGPDDPSAEDRAKAFEAQQEARLADHLAACGVEPRSVENIMAGLFDSTATAGVRDWLASGKTFLCLAGPKGRGKTTAAASVLRCARKPVTFMGAGGKLAATWAYSSALGLFVRSAELAHTSEYADEGRGRWAKVRSVEWLVIDDLGMERMDNAGIWAEAIDHLIDARYARKLKTVITTNLDGKTFDARYGDRILDRVRHDGHFVICAEGESFRTPEAA